ncbi:Dabb family protein [Emticicia sp. 17c]|uniref:Dabb family protein n=1 Tax=Emticicia sp. 17c TaxID=3127704 RepID=UPI00301BDED8
MRTLLLAIALLSFTYMANAQKKEPAKVLRHAVLFKFKDSSTPEDIKKVEDAFRALPGQIKEISGFEWGTNNSPENLNQGYTHMFFLTFKSEKDREVYLPHPAHKAFGKVLGPHLDKVLVLDYWTSK